MNGMDGLYHDALREVVRRKNEDEEECRRGVAKMLRGSDEDRFAARILLEAQKKTGMPLGDLLDALVEVQPDGSMKSTSTMRKLEKFLDEATKSKEG